MSYKIRLDGFQSYKLWLGITLHFADGPYDIFKMKGRINAPRNKFDERNDRSFFYKFSEEYLKGDLANFYMANIMEGKTHISEYTDITFREWKSKMHRIEYIFEEDCKKLQYLAAKNEIEFYGLFKSVTGGLPIVIQLMNGGHIHLETICIIDKILEGGLLMRFDDQIRDNFVWPDIRNRMISYNPWITVKLEKLKQILIEYK